MSTCHHFLSSPSGLLGVTPVRNQTRPSSSIPQPTFRLSRAMLANFSLKLERFKKSHRCFIEDEQSIPFKPAFFIANNPLKENCYMVVPASLLYDSLFSHIISFHFILFASKHQEKQSQIANRRIYKNEEYKNSKELRNLAWRENTSCGGGSLKFYEAKQKTKNPCNGSQ